MKKVITILISCSLALAASVIAQQDEQQQKPKKQKAQPAKSQPASEAKPAPKPQQQSAPRQHVQPKAPAQEKGPQSSESSNKSHTATKAPEKDSRNANVRKEQTEQRDKERNATNESETETANKPPGPAPATEREQSNAGGAPGVNRPNPQGKKLNAQKRPDPQSIQKIKTQHASFRAQPRPDKVPAATFNQGYRISGSEHWQGPQYQVFRSYHPEWHDRGWYHSHFNRVELIGGGYYYWNNGYWFPAWGYDTSAQYYAYDAPIYVGSHAEPPDRVIADVQAALQEMGYYQGEVDGLLGPLTREALTAYQTDHGLYTTAVIDEPTLSSLGMS
jgi:putative peptidoglycan binding protein